MEYIIILALITIDQIAKYFAELILKTTNVDIIKNILEFTYVENKGAAFGILQDSRWLFIIITLIIVGTMIYYYESKIKKEKKAIYKLAYILMISGAIGNFIDRVIRGYVVDFINVNFIDYPVFNIADIYVFISVCIILIFTIFEKK